MYATDDKKGHVKVSLTLTFKVNCQGQVIGFVFFEILDLEKVRIDTEILSVLYVQPEITEGHNSIYLRPWFWRSTVKVKWFILAFLKSPTSEMLKWDTKINSAS